jgi:hypothetical protein
MYLSPGYVEGNVAVSIKAAEFLADISDFNEGRADGPPRKRDHLTGCRLLGWRMIHGLLS